MTAPDFTAIEARMQQAKAALNDAMENAVRAMDRFERENKPTAEEQRRMQQAALRGELGDGMRTLAQRVETGQDNWDAIFSNRSPNAHLLQDHLTRMVEANREAIQRAFEQDDEFDPSVEPEADRPER
ncbi:hypothetical protein [Allorhizocola rhizosphaerae]|uniref:hypothetical protein n=1 Tax=Allorhizocola rhizosphaerae TaxID=1872709 RepID=UPI000E3C6325|nr:hypothetical protein [Allorhizocola rhizosphaerae]